MLVLGLTALLYASACWDETFADIALGRTEMKNNLGGFTLSHHIFIMMSFKMPPDDELNNNK
jgi:hypothetical protein